MTQEVKGRFPYECANIGNDDYTTYPVDAEGKVTQVDVIENGKLLKFITPANAKARMDKQIVDNLKVSSNDTSSNDTSSNDTSSNDTSSNDTSSNDTSSNDTSSGE